MLNLDYFFLADKKNRRNSAICDNQYIVNGEIELEVFNSFLIKKVRILIILSFTKYCQQFTK